MFLDAFNFQFDRYLHFILWLYLNKTRLYDSNKVAPKSFIYDDINVLFKNDDNN